MCACTTSMDANEWRDRWAGWIDEQIDGCLGEYVDVHVWKDTWVQARTDGSMNGCMCGHMNERMDGLMDKWIYECMSG